MREIGALIIQLIHWLVLLFIFLTPFFGDEYLMTLHMILVPFIMLHWLTNQTVCALTELEKIVRGGCNDDETFFGRVMTPIYKGESFVGKIAAPFYKFKDEDEEKRTVWVGLILLWVITLSRLAPTGFARLRRDLAVVRSRLQF
jgi:hypothetical protein